SGLYINAQAYNSYSYSSATGAHITAQGRYAPSGVAGGGSGTGLSIYSYGYGTYDSYAIYAGAYGETSGNRWAFYGTGGNFYLSGNMGLGSTNMSYRFYVNGNSYFQGSGWYTGSWNLASDKRLKENITEITGVLEDLSQLRGVKFKWNELAGSLGHEQGKNEIGVIAQEIERIYPELVTESKLGYKGVDYSKLTAVLIEAVKELKAEKDALEARVEALEKRQLGRVTTTAATP
ncbi:MAG: tail fiber domain-containing protein, partial [Fidelibacterota bacterium]